MKLILLLLILFTLNACTPIVAPTLHPLQRPPLPRVYPRIVPKWGEV